MELTKDTFKKIVLCSIIFPFLYITVESLPFFSDYEVLEEDLNLSYVDQLISIEVSLVIISLSFLTNLISLILLYLFKPIGRPIYLWSYLLMILFIMFNGDWIQYSISYPLDVIESFLEVFILYLIYLSPLKEEFQK